MLKNFWGAISRPKPKKSYKHRRIFINFNGFDIELNFKSNVKNLRLRVDKNTKISMSLPFYATQKSATEFLNANIGWLENTYAKAIKNLPKDDEFLFLGQSYKIIFDKSLNDVFIKDDKIFAKNLTALESFKKTKAKEIFSEYITKFRPLIGKEITHLSIKKMSTRWGSCNSRKGYINLNLNLLEKPLPLIEYVVLHELTHLLYAHHQASFYAFIKSIMSDFRERERALNGKNL